MNPELFGPNRAGELLPIEGGEYAFWPASLPPGLALDDRIWQLVADVQGWIGRVAAIRDWGVPLTDPALLLRTVERRESIRSSSIEGTIVSPAELAAYEESPIEPEHILDPANRSREVHNLAEALRQGARAAQTGPIDLPLLLKLHAKLFEGVRGKNRRPGELREGQVYIGTTHRFIPPPPDRVPALLENLFDYIESKQDLPPVVRALIVHYQFEAIHPFVDGNGRLGRLLLSLLIGQWSELDGPWINVSAYLDARRDPYIDHLFAVSAEGAWLEWIEFGLVGIRESCRETVSRLKQLVELLNTWKAQARAQGMKSRIDKLLERLLERPVIDITTASEIMDCAYNTARTDLEQLHALGMISEMPDRTPTSYLAAEALRIIHAE